MKPEGVIIVTRIATAKGGIVPSSQWLEAREALLDRVTAACVRCISVPVVWVWQVDAAHLERVRAMACRVYPGALVCEEEPPDGDMPFRSCATVRLDSDDAIMPKSIDSLLGMDMPSGTLVDWPCGYQLNWSTGAIGEWASPPRKQGPFLAIFHERHHLFDIGGDHSEARCGRRHVVMRGRHWLQTVHGGNLLNHWRDEAELPAEMRDAVLARAGVRLP